MKERLQKILSARGVTSRRKAEEWILAGRLQVNGQIAHLGDSADPDTDEILLDGKPLPTQPSHPRSSPSPPAPNPSRHHSLFQ